MMNARSVLTDNKDCDKSIEISELIRNFIVLLYQKRNYHIKETPLKLLN